MRAVSLSPSPDISDPALPVPYPLAGGWRTARTTMRWSGSWSRQPGWRPRRTPRPCPGRLSCTPRICRTQEPMPKVRACPCACRKNGKISTAATRSNHHFVPFTNNKTKEARIMKIVESTDMFDNLTPSYVLTLHWLALLGSTLDNR